MTEIITPDWVRDAVFYQIFPDRFAMSSRVPKPSHLEAWDAPPTPHGFKGGDLLGVAEHLEYLQDLGVNAIYFNPIFQSAANHRYHTYDYYHVDPILGGNTAFQEMLEAAHSTGMRVILDGVFNHASRGFFQFHHILENGPQSPYIDWFNIKDFPLKAYNDNGEEPQYDAWWGLPALPKFNTDTPAVREFLWDVSAYWMERGIDGWRLDVPEEIDDDEFWREFRRRVKGVNADAYIVGEIWHEAQRWLEGDQFDAVMNYLFTRATLGAVIDGGPDPEAVANTGYGQIPPIDMHQLADTLDHLLGLYAEPIAQVQLNLLGSHDTPRILHLARGDESAVQLAVALLMTYVGAPCVYYGDEIGLAGGRDPGCREGFPWEEGHWNHDLRNYHKRWIALRHEHPALRRGGYTRLHADDDLLVFGRRCDEETLLVALNRSQATQTPEPDLNGWLDDGATLADVWENDSRLRVADGKLRDLKLAPRSARVYGLS